MTDGGVSTDRLLYVPEDIYPSISKYIINKADVFITVAGTIGRVGKIPDELDGANLTENADRLVLAVVNQDWLIKVLQSGMIQEQIAEATTQVGQPKLAIVRIERFLIPLPPRTGTHCQRHQYDAKHSAEIVKQPGIRHQSCAYAWFPFTSL